MSNGSLVYAESTRHDVQVVEVSQQSRAWLMDGGDHLCRVHSSSIENHYRRTRIVSEFYCSPTPGNFGQQRHTLHGRRAVQSTTDKSWNKTKVPKVRFSIFFTDNMKCNDIACKNCYMNVGLTSVIMSQ